MVLCLVAYNKGGEEESSKIGAYPGHMPTQQIQGISLQQSFRCPFVCLQNPCFAWSWEKRATASGSGRDIVDYIHQISSLINGPDIAGRVSINVPNSDSRKSRLRNRIKR